MNGEGKKFTSMKRNLFLQPKYTIDTSVLLALMNEGEKYNNKTFKQLWLDVCKLCEDGKIISHIEVFKEIKDGGVPEQISWAKSNENIFQDYNLYKETVIIRDIGNMGPGFVKFLQQGKQKAIHADPWIVAQAKVEDLILITEESSGNYKIPHICKVLKIRSVDILGLMREEGWTY